MNKYRICQTLILSCIIFFGSSHLNFSQQNNYSSSEILQALKKLNVLGSLLYVAAHPDDENTSVLTYMSKGKQTRTAYLSLTRGDGGQNLLGNEKGDLLGVIRTQELLSARKIDGAEQFFTRAIDFGYSKTAKETLRNWDKEILLGDVVKVIREFKPDVILTRFSKTQGGHGQHLASAILAEEAFYAAADENKFSEQLDKLKPWQAKRLYWNTWRPSDKAISLDIGEYNSVIGKSFNEISAEARSMHKSQGFGVSPTRGSQLQYFDHLAGDIAHADLFDDIDLSWNRVDGGESMVIEIGKILNKYNPNNPSGIVSDLVKIYKKLNNITDNYWRIVKQKEIKELIKMCSGLWMESTVSKPEISKGESIEVKSMILNRSNIPIILESIETTFSNTDLDISQKLEHNKPVSINVNITIPSNHKYSQPYWLTEAHDGKMFTVTEEKLVGNAENKPEISSSFIVNIYEESFSYQIRTIHKWNDAVKGEQTRPFVIRPDLSISVDQDNLIFANGKTKVVKVNLVSKIDSAIGKLKLVLPEGWKSNKQYYDFYLLDKGDRENFSFSVSQESDAKTGKAKFLAEINGNIFTEEIVEMDYPHIKHQTVLKPVSIDLIKLDIKVEPKRIGYIMGSGDDIPLSLSQLGYSIDLLSDEDLDRKDLSEYDVIICGIRAFNTRQELERQQKRLNEFVENGGTWIVQHNTRFGINVDQIGPYLFSTRGRDRIAEEDAHLEILNPRHPIFNYPNKVSQKDFEGWVQERGLYFADSWDKNMVPLLSGSDEGESSKMGGLLYSEYGKGAFIFTAFSWFRQLPAGVPGAYKLFVNMISAKGK